MPLALNSRLGRFEVRSQIGAGGMGEVYLAEDTRLHRKVALKILPADLASNEDRMRRFEQEATAAAALNHPNIAHIYEIGESGGTHFIAMEFVDGQTLRELIHQQQTELAKLLRHLQHVAEGLAKAHAAGIVHRDLKPDNIMVARDGYVKMLDFGLAKLVEPQKSLGDQDMSEVATQPLPQHSLPGMVMGTVGYMSPEQAQGRVKEIDQRSDIFSFGCILFEAATGQKAFAGKDALDSLHKIVHAPTPQIKEINREAPDELQKIVRRCLAKDPEKRYQSIKDVAIELEELRQGLQGINKPEHSAQPTSKDSVVASDAGPDRGPTADATRPETARPTSSAEYLVSGIKRHKAGATIALLAFVAVLAAVGYGIYRFAGAKKPTAHFEKMKFTRLTNTGRVKLAVISPDGKYVGYVNDENGKRSLWLKQIVTSQTVQIVPPTNELLTYPSFSSDSNFIYYVASEDNVIGTLYRVGALGGAPHKLIVDVDSPVAFSPDGKRMVFARGPGRGGSALIIADADGTNERQLVNHQMGEDEFYSGTWSPDGKVIACAAGHGVNNDTVIAVDAESGKEKLIGTQRWDNVDAAAWLPDGSALVVDAANKTSGAQIWLISYPGGEARQVTSDLIGYRRLSLTSDGSALVALHSETQTHIWLAPGNKPDEARQMTSGNGVADGSAGLAWTPDDHIIYTNAGLWTMDVTDHEPKQLTPAAEKDYQPAVTPDGRYIVFASFRNGNLGIWRMDADGSNQKQLIGTESVSQHAFTPDGKRVIYDNAVGQNAPRLWQIGIDGGEPVRLTDFISAMPRISPDGKQLLCYYSIDAPANVAYNFGTIPLEGGQPTKVYGVPLSANIHHQVLQWMPDGRAIAFIDNRSGVRNIWGVPLGGGQPTPLTHFTSDGVFYFAWSRDGKQLALSRGNETTDAVLISEEK